jgi:hypothetical protein
VRTAAWSYGRTTKASPSSGPGIEPLARDPLFIVPLVLADSSGWIAQSWNRCANGTQFNRPPIKVTPGESILGQVIGSDCDVATGVCTTWTVPGRNWMRERRQGQLAQLNDGALLGGRGR